MAKFNISRLRTPEKVAEAWKHQYGRTGVWRGVYYSETAKSKSAKEIYDDLCHSTTLDECDKAIGNTSWTTNNCHSCEKASRKPMIEMEAGSDEVHRICASCLHEAYQTLLKGTPS